MNKIPRYNIVSPALKDLGVSGNPDPHMKNKEYQDTAGKKNACQAPGLLSPAV
jgi:hypothetical protein